MTADSTDTHLHPAAHRPLLVPDPYRWWHTPFYAVAIILAAYLFINGVLIVPTGVMHQIYAMLCWIGAFLAVIVALLVVLLAKP